MNTTATILKAARDLIAKPENWTQGTYARDARGNEIGVRSDIAVCFCSLGAISAVSGNCDDAGMARDAIAALTRNGIVNFNDTHTHSEVLDLFSKAIKAAEGEQS